MIRPVRRWARIGALATITALSACTGSRPAGSVAEPGTSPANPETVATTTTTTAPPTQPVVRRIGQSFVLDDLRLTMLSVQDPFPPTAQTLPAPGNRLASIKYEVVNDSSAPRNLSDLPTVEMRDSSGGSYRSAHGRLSVVGGAGGPGVLSPGKRMEGSAVFEVPASATNLSVSFRSLSRPGDQGVVVTLD